MQTHTFDDSKVRAAAAALQRRDTCKESKGVAETTSKSKTIQAKPIGQKNSSKKQEEDKEETSAGKQDGDGYDSEE